MGQENFKLNHWAWRIIKSLSGTLKVSNWKRKLKKRFVRAFLLHSSVTITFLTLQWQWTTWSSWNAPNFFHLTVFAHTLTFGWEVLWWPPASEHCQEPMTSPCVQEPFQVAAWMAFPLGRIKIGSLPVYSCSVVFLLLS